MRLQLLLDGPEFLAALADDLPRASGYVYAQALTFEGDAAGRAFATLLGASPAPDRRLLVDDFSRHVVSDRCVWLHPFDRALRGEVREGERILAALRAGGAVARHINRIGGLLDVPRRNHKKLVVLDDRVAYVGGINFSDHNFAWRDMMIRVADADVAAFLREDFLFTCAGRNVARRQRFDGITLTALDGRSNDVGLAPVMERIASARTSIFVECPYLTEPFLTPLREAARRGVAVTLVVPARNNWAALGHCLAAEAGRGEIDVRFYAGRMTHMKAMLLDDEVLLAGSANFDVVSYAFQQEYVAEITDPGLLEAFRTRVRDVDLACSLRTTPAPTRSALRWARWQMAGLQHVSRLGRPLATPH